MARIVVGSYMVRYPLGGMLSWALQYVVGLHRLGQPRCFRAAVARDCVL